MDAGLVPVYLVCPKTCDERIRRELTGLGWDDCAPFDETKKLGEAQQTQLALLKEKRAFEEEKQAFELEKSELERKPMSTTGVGTRILESATHPHGGAAPAGKKSAPKKGGFMDRLFGQG